MPQSSRVFSLLCFHHHLLNITIDFNDFSPSSLSPFPSHFLCYDQQLLTLIFILHCCCRTGLTLNDLMPENPKTYDKMRPPKKEGQATTVYFHVTVMGLDSIDETSMVSYYFFLLLHIPLDLHLLRYNSFSIISTTYANS